MNETQSPGRRPAEPGRRAPDWLALSALTGVCTWAMLSVRFPAAPLLGAMCAAVVMAIRADGMKLPGPLFRFGQGVIGMMVGLQMPQNFLDEVRRSWPLFLGGVAWAVAASAVLGWLLTKWAVFPGTTAIWGLSPGAATSMTVMSESYGGDIRVVAFMQYFRNTAVVVTTALVARFWAGVEAPASVAAGAWPGWPDAPALLLTLGVIILALALAERLRVPAGSILVPMFAGIFFNYSGLLRLMTPPWLLSLGSLLIGWSIGLRFNRPVLRQIARSVPSVLLAVSAIIAMCGAFGGFMVLYAGIDPLTAYLATCPGGLDSVAIIAASAHVDVSFVLAMHSARFILVVLTGPFLARQIVKRVRRREAPEGR